MTPPRHNFDHLLGSRLCADDLPASEPFRHLLPRSPHQAAAAAITTPTAAAIVAAGALHSTQPTRSAS